MPEKSSHTPPRQVRVSDDDWADLQEAAKLVGSERAPIIRGLIRWYLRRPGAELPTRPNLEEVDAARTQGGLHAVESTPNDAQ
jgi:hypothetical protein